MIWRALCSGVSLLLLTAACSSTHSTLPVHTVSIPKACDVVTASDAANVLETAVVANSAPHSPTWACQYLATGLDATTHVPAGMAVASIQHGSGSTWARLFDLRRAGKVRDASSHAPSAAVQGVSGVGDEALWDGTWLLTRDGDWLLQISVRDVDRPDRARAVALARLALRHLPR